jgi:transcriptional regulator with XRE-family HTH domain
VNGAEVRSLREKIGLKRPQLVELAGPPLTVAKLAGIETGRDMRYDELQALQAAFGKFEAGRRYLLGEPEPVVESPKLDDTSQRSDPTRWTSENPSIEARLEHLASQTRGGARRKKVIVPDHTEWARFSEWLGMAQGDTVRVKAATANESGKANWVKGQFVFVQRVLNKTTGESWIDVKGGFRGRVLMRSFTEDRVVKSTVRRKK